MSGDRATQLKYGDVAVILDIDGTLVDNTYFHTVAWWRACRDCGVEVDMATLHRLIGMGSDQFTRALVGEEREDLSKAHSHHMETFVDEMRPCPGTLDLLPALHRRGIRILVATSSTADALDRLLSLVEHRDLIEYVCDGDDVAATKPAPDLFGRALAHFGGPPERALAIGDTGWDAESAGRNGIASIGVQTGGWSSEELLGAGCAEVRKDVAEVVATMDSGAIGKRLGTRG